MNYRNSRWVGEDATPPFAGGPSPGDRAPDAPGLRQPYIGRAIRLAELLRGTGHTLIVYADASLNDQDYRSLAQLANDLSAAYGNAITTYGILSPDAHPLDLERCPILTDAEGTFRATYGINAPSRNLIRPDGHIAYRATPPNPDRLHEYLRRILNPKSLPTIKS